jgi:hypothetical protein
VADRRARCRARVRVWQIGALAAVLGVNNAFENPARQSFMLEMVGRVMSLWFVAFQGSIPIGGPLVGWVMAWAGARAGLGVGAITCLLVGLIGMMALRGIAPFACSDSAPRPAES